MAGIGVITNPRSRQNRRNPQLAERLAYVLGEKGRLASPTSHEALDEVAQHFLEHEIEIVAINGGDGTSHVVISALVRAYGDRPLPRIALLRGGTMNTVASGLGVRGEPHELLGALTTAYHRETPLRLARRSLLLVDGKAGFLFGNGIISNFLEAYYEGSEPTPVKAAWVLAKAVGSAFVQGQLIQRLARPVNARVSLDGRPWQDMPWMALAAGTTDDIGLGFRPFYRSLQHPGHLHALGVGCTPVQLVPQLWRIYRSLGTQHPRIIEGVAREMIIEADEPLTYMIDGDFHRGGQRLELRVGPEVELVLL
ncbi:MAG: diacylglycerol kinase [Proteobacteria bacterium]|nr:diacylglycerol kinase [Pseudomonadota bacterium]MCP4920813.1 diacylglycerol kinase [Pseudomonadota bacterium]